MERKKITQDQFTQIAMQRAEIITRKEYNLREDQHLNSQQWIFRNGAYAMCTTLMEREFEVIEEEKK
jgi:hypothetical protein